jgi:C_GCAxxG_C_C family probable redox protein
MMPETCNTGLEEIMGNVEVASSLFREGFSCSQSVCAAYSETYGFEKEQALKMSSAFGGGMGLNDEVCGVVSGALMVIGMKFGRVKADDGKAKKKCYSLAGEFFEKFKSRFGTVRCAGLLGCDISTEDGMKTALEKDLFTTRCADLVKSAAELVEQIL